VIPYPGGVSQPLSRRADLDPYAFIIHSRELKCHGRGRRTMMRHSAAMRSIHRLPNAHSTASLPRTKTKKCNLCVRSNGSSQKIVDRGRAHFSAHPFWIFVTHGSTLRQYVTELSLTARGTNRLQRKKLLRQKCPLISKVCYLAIFFSCFVVLPNFSASTTRAQGKQKPDPNHSGSWRAALSASRIWPA
jgi:hypothetical protein